MADKKVARDAEGKEGLSEHMVCICAGNVLERKLKKWGLKNILRRQRLEC
jgi:hypothetical protein